MYKAINTDTGATIETFNTPHAALKAFHDAVFTWVTRITLNDNIGTRSNPKAHSAKDGSDVQS